MKKIGFMLAEILIALVVIGVITGILLPSAVQTTPNEKVLKFKNGYNSIVKGVRELVTSDDYFQNGDLGITKDGKDVVDNDTMRTYFCRCLSDLLNTKKVDCNETVGGHYTAVFTNGNDKGFNTAYTATEVTKETLKAAKDKLDKVCLQAQKIRHKEIILPNEISFYSTSSASFGSRSTSNEEGIKVGEKRYFTPPEQFPANYADNQGFDVVYKIYCIELDDFNSGEHPFGLGIRGDGRILNGTRTDEWLEKEIQN